MQAESRLFNIQHVYTKKNNKLEETVNCNAATFLVRLATCSCYAPGFTHTPGKGKK